MIQKEILDNLYNQERMSMMEIANKLGCSQNRVAYWMSAHGFERRTISEAIYQQHNPDGDPFRIKRIKTKEDAELFGIGLGLYWGEGTKANKHTIRLGNTDPELLKMFIRFLVELFGVDKEKLKFGLQIFTDIDPATALLYWCNKLEAKPSQFYKVHVTISGSLGTYKRKSKYGVVTVYFHNKKLRDIFVGMLPR